ncbi:hypothetical protein H5410_053157 [Solanum commersonii]|uniref:Uncharacterized protein n=1 Tax=Solanum commersonii TaxID=4109 RepID=A0A9J5X3M1_SOLCO|nr:hypothetical protein H5410_053157 [Solanum commersonii]
MIRGPLSSAELSSQARVLLGPEMVSECRPHPGCRLGSLISKSFPLIRAYSCFQIIMPPRRAARGHPARRNVKPQEQELPNAHEVQLQ